MVINAFHVKIC